MSSNEIMQRSLMRSRRPRKLENDGKEVPNVFCIFALGFDFFTFRTDLSSATSRNGGRFWKTCTKRVTAHSKDPRSDIFGTRSIPAALKRGEVDLHCGEARNGVREEPVRLPSFFFFPRTFAVSLHLPPSFSVSRNIFLSLLFFLFHFLSSSVYRTGTPAHPYCRFQAPAYLILWEIHTSPSLRWEYEGSPRTLGRTFLFLPPFPAPSLSPFFLAPTLLCLGPQ